MKYRRSAPIAAARVTAVTSVPSQPYTFYMGSTTGAYLPTLGAVA
jgi:hypothetical protein